MNTIETTTCIATDNNGRLPPSADQLYILKLTDQESQSESSSESTSPEDWHNSSSEEMPSPCSAATDTSTAAITDAEVEELCGGGDEGAVIDLRIDETDNKRADEVVTPPLPKGCTPLIHQVAGHIHGKGKTKAGQFLLILCLTSRTTVTSVCIPEGRNGRSRDETKYRMVFFRN